MSGDNKEDYVWALRRLADKLTQVENDPSFQGIWTFLHAHGYVYSGPDWRDALADARLMLARVDNT